jgi:hypothetical protein
MIPQTAYKKESYDAAQFVLGACSPAVGKHKDLSATLAAAVCTAKVKP